MMEKLREAAEADHTDADCFGCVFLSHGEESHVFAHDDMVDIKEITALFRGDQCKSLVGKPKIFIFQACRWDITDNAVAGMALNEMYSEVEEDAASVYTLPAGADFLMCYCVAEG
ncbi:caspase-6-like [Pygocentrus nattereri]|nr:caspase-6-like [Pygocentrus nattereri]